MQRMARSAPLGASSARGCCRPRAPNPPYRRKTQGDQVKSTYPPVFYQPNQIQKLFRSQSRNDPWARGLSVPFRRAKRGLFNLAVTVRTPPLFLFAVVRSIGAHDAPATGAIRPDLSGGLSPWLPFSLWPTNKHFPLFPFLFFSAHFTEERPIIAWKMRPVKFAMGF